MNHLDIVVAPSIEGGAPQSIFTLLIEVVPDAGIITGPFENPVFTVTGFRGGMETPVDRS